MSGLAKVARILGAEVTGSDRSLEGHAAENVPPGAEVVYSSAIPPDNPERTTGAPELHRADLLAELTQLKPTIAVSGTHGKTTTTSMLVHALPGQSYLVGGEVRSTGTNADWTDGEWLIVEADESDRSLLKLHPTIAVVTNAELDHHTEYASSRDVDDTFREFLARARDAVVAPDLTRLRAGRARVRRVRRAAPGAGRAQPPQRRGRARRRSSSPGETCRRRRAASPRSPAPAGASRSSARPTARRSSTTTPTTRPRSAPRSRPRARRAPTGSSRSSSRTCSAAPSGRRRRSAQALAQADLVVQIDVYPARERQEDYPGDHRPADRPAHRRRPPRRPRDLGEDARHRPRFSATDVAGGRPPAHDGRRRREHDREGPGRA